MRCGGVGGACNLRFFGAAAEETRGCCAGVRYEGEKEGETTCEDGICEEPGIDGDDCWLARRERGSFVEGGGGCVETGVVRGRTGGYSAAYSLAAASRVMSPDITRLEMARAFKKKGHRVEEEVCACLQDTQCLIAASQVFAVCPGEEQRPQSERRRQEIDP